MGKGFSLKGRTEVKECLAFQSPNPFPAVWNAGLRCSTHACPHTHKCLQLSLCFESLCPLYIQTQVVLKDWIKGLKINVHLQVWRKHWLWVLSPLNSLTFHLSSHLLLGHRVSPMLSHQSAGDVGNLSGRPNPHFSCKCVSADRHVYAPEAFSRNLPDCVASPGSPRQVSVNGCISSDHSRSDILKLGQPDHGNLSHTSSKK